MKYMVGSEKSSASSTWFFHITSSSKYESCPLVRWVWPPPSNSGKWRFIGIPDPKNVTKCNNPGGHWNPGRGATPNLYDLYGGDLGSPPIFVLFSPGGNSIWRAYFYQNGTMEKYSPFELVNTWKSRAWFQNSTLTPYQYFQRSNIWNYEEKDESLEIVDYN